jgi:hypothetical protein
MAKTRTWKIDKNGKRTSVFAIYFRLTEEQFAVIQRLADADCSVSCGQLLKRIAV